MSITAHDLFVSCPADHIRDMAVACQAVADQDWLKASTCLKSIAAQGDTDWHTQCADLADDYDTKGYRAAYWSDGQASVVLTSSDDRTLPDAELLKIAVEAFEQSDMEMGDGHITIGLWLPGPLDS